MLQMAYGIKSDSQLEGVSGWMTSEHFDVDVKLSDEEVVAEKNLPWDTQADRWALLMQGLMVDRFHLKTNEATKDVPVYELVVAKGGPKLKPSEMEDDPAKPGTKKTVKPSRESQHGQGKLDGQAIAISTLTEALGRQPELGGGKFFGGGRMVVDKTGLTGEYDWTLVWTPANAEPGAALPDPNVPGLFTAIEEQLGLKLVPGKAPAQVLVVEHIERPTEN